VSAGGRLPCGFRPHEGPSRNRSHRGARRTARTSPSVAREVRGPAEAPDFVEICVERREVRARRILWPRLPEALLGPGMGRAPAPSTIGLMPAIAPRCKIRRPSTPNSRLMPEKIGRRPIAPLGPVVVHNPVIGMSESAQRPPDTVRTIRPGGRESCGPTRGTERRSGPPARSARERRRCRGIRRPSARRGPV